MVLKLHPLHKPTKPPAPEEGLTAPVTSRIIEIQAAVCAAFDIDLVGLLSDRRARHLSEPRQAAYLMAQQYTLHSLPVIAKHFRRHDHTTLLWGIKRALKRIEGSAEYRAKVDRAREILGRIEQHRFPDLAVNAWRRYPAPAVTDRTSE